MSQSCWFVTVYPCDHCQVLRTSKRLCWSWLLLYYSVLCVVIFFALLFWYFQLCWWQCGHHCSSWCMTPRANRPLVSYWVVITSLFVYHCKWGFCADADCATSTDMDCQSSMSHLDAQIFAAYHTNRHTFFQYYWHRFFCMHSPSYYMPVLPSPDLRSYWKTCCYHHTIIYTIAKSVSPGCAPLLVARLAWLLLGARGAILRRVLQPNESGKYLTRPYASMNNRNELSFGSRYTYISKLPI